MRRGNMAPLYDYVCKECNHSEEVVARYEEPRVIECPKCHTENFERQACGKMQFRLDSPDFYCNAYKNNRP